MKQYYLPHNKSEATPGNIIFFDTETIHDPTTAYETGQYQRLRCGVAIAGRLEAGKWTREKVCRFTTIPEFWSFVESRQHPKIPTWLYAHNIGFDLQVIGFPELLWEGRFKVFDTSEDTSGTNILRGGKKRDKGFLCLDNPPVIIAGKYDDTFKIVAVDTFNYWNTSLEKIGQMVGVPKGKMPTVDDSDTQWFDYCEQDVRVLQTAVIRLINWVKDNKLGKFRFTAPSLALAAFRHRFYDHKIVCHDNDKLRSFERTSYYGGRLETWFIGDTHQKTYELDVTSLYPSVMKGNLYPCRVSEFATIATHTKVKPCSIDISTIAEVKLKTREQYPKRQLGMGTIYPVGEYWTTLAGPELVRARDNGDITEIRQWMKFDLKPLFNSFVDFFWDYRHKMLAEGRELEANLAKLLMNGLYGKFGQKTSEWIDRPDLIADTALGEWSNLYANSDDFEMFRNVGKCVQQWVGKGEHPYAFPAIAAYVTSYAREYMYCLRECAGRHNTFYIATDALFVNQDGYDNLAKACYIDDNALGKLKVKAVSDTATFEALHYYKVGDRQTRGSRKKRGIEHPDGSVTELQFESLEASLKRKPDASVHVRPVVKRYAREYKRGYVTPTGWVLPLTIEE